MSKAVFGIAKNEVQAANIVHHLKLAGFSRDDISVLMPDKSGTHDFAFENQTKAPEGAVAGASTGAIVGGALGWLSGIGALAIPGLGPLIAAGPIMAALSDAALGGVSGALVGLGIPEFEARRYEGKVKGGAALISVHSENSEKVARAREILHGAGVEDITSSREEYATNEER